MSGDFALILNDILFIERDSECSPQERQALYDKIMIIFLPDKSSGKFASTIQDTLKNLKSLKNSKNAIYNLERRLIDPEFLEHTFDSWNVVLNSPKLY